jgi:DNA-binding LacI/PurR family transcriptional regulator
LQQDIPFVLIERNFSDPSVNCIYFDNIEGAYRATRHLIERGHRKIAHIAGNIYNQVTLDRIEGYKKALHEAGIGFTDEWITFGNYLSQGGYEAMKEILKQDYTAVFAGNDTMAYGAMLAISETGLTIPGDLAVIGLDDLEFSGLTNPPLSTIRQPRHEMGVKSLELLAEILQGTQENGVKICFAPELIIRKSA